MDWKNYVILASALVNIFLGFFVYFKGRNRLVNTAYALIAGSVFFWSVSMVLYRAFASPFDSLFWCRILYSAPIFIVGSFLFFTYIFPQENGETKARRKMMFLILFVCALIFGGIVLTSGIVEEVVIRPGQEKQIFFGVFYPLYTLLISGIFIWGYINLLLKRRRSQGIVRSQATYVFLGTFLASIAGMATNLILPTLGVFSLNWAGQVLSLIMVIFIAYAIVRHRLMDVKLVMRRSSVYLASLITVIGMVFVVRYIFLGQLFLGKLFFVDFITLIIAVSVFPAIRNYYYKIANKYFFSSLYDAQRVIAELSDKLSLTLEDRRVYDLICDTLADTFHAEAVGILTYNSQNKKYVVQTNRGFDVGSVKEFDGDVHLREEYIGKNEPIVVEEVKGEMNGESKKTIEMLVRLKVAVLAPLSIKRKTIGLIALGPKESRDSYNSEDLAVLEVISAQAAIAIQNALLFKRTREFNIKLKREIQKATKELVHTNKKLRKLDKTKSEFISIASHQLRTPLTSIKGFTSLLLEGSYGTMSNEQREAMNKIYISNERLIMLVEDLLNVSRIERGKIKYEFQEVNIEDLVKNIIKVMTIQAKSKKLYLKFKNEIKQSSRLIIKADFKKIAEVIGNLIDNSIKYTKEGGVAVSLKEKEGGVRVEVSDTGIGIDAGEMPKLFEKFSRGRGINRFHTEGTGLGLYIVKKLTEAHGGKVGVSSPGKGKGSTFYIELPQKQTEADGEKRL